MKIPERPTLVLYAVHGLGALGALALVCAFFVTVVLPLQQRSIESPRLRKALDETGRRCSELIRANQDASAALLGATRVVEQEEQRGNLTDAQLMALIAEKVSAAHISLQAIEPIPVPSSAARPYREVRVKGRGRFPSLHRAIALLEAESPYLHVLELSVVGPASHEGVDAADCELGWLLRLNATPQALAPETPEAS